MRKKVVVDDYSNGKFSGIEFAVICNHETRYDILRANFMGMSDLISHLDNLIDLNNISGYIIDEDNNEIYVYLRMCRNGREKCCCLCEHRVSFNSIDGLIKCNDRIVDHGICNKYLYENEDLE